MDTTFSNTQLQGMLYNACKALDQAQATIAELRVKLVDSESLSKAFMSKLPNDYSWDECPSEYIADLQDKLSEAEKASSAYQDLFNEATQERYKIFEILNDRCNKYENELSRLLEAVPKDVRNCLITLIDITWHECSKSSEIPCLSWANEIIDKSEILPIISVLITRSQEERRTEIIDAFYTGTSWQFESVDASCEGSMKAAEEYADQILKDKTECKCENTTPTSEITRQCQDCGRQWLGRMEKDNDVK